MEDKEAALTVDRSTYGQRSKVSEFDSPQKDTVVMPEEDTGSEEDTSQVYMIDPKCGKYIAGEINMEATINPDDVIRAGGFGARDDLSSLLPVASDSTDFESSLLDARYYEEPQGEQRRPGLGWSEDRESE